MSCQPTQSWPALLIGVPAVNGIEAGRVRPELAAGGHGGGQCETALAKGPEIVLADHRLRAGPGRAVADERRPLPCGSGLGTGLANRVQWRQVQIGRLTLRAKAQVR